MAKRKREAPAAGSGGQPSIPAKKTKKAQDLVGSSPTTASSLPTIQIVAGSYDRVLHGVMATVEPSTSPANEGSKKKKAAQSPQPSEKARFADTFLFNAHMSAIRCLALSPPSAEVPGQQRRVMLATGSTDERINLYNLTAQAPSAGGRRSEERRALAEVAARPIVESSGNRELGTLLHHDAPATQLAFPTRGKLLSSAEDSTIAITRTRDWSLLGTVKVPVPKPVGRPSGDTAALGGVPKGVNAFAVHPSMKLMISVSKGERAMRLWNLVTGKKAGVLNFGRDVLGQIGEGRHGTGEGRKVVWGSSNEGGDEFAVAFDRDVLVFGMDSRPRCRVMSDLKRKVHQIAYLKPSETEDDTVLAVSTEDGRILLFSTKTDDLVAVKGDHKDALPTAKLIAQLGGKDTGVSGRIKDFTALPVDGEDGQRIWYVVTAGSDGKLRLWKLRSSDLVADHQNGGERQVGELLGTYETQSRITCVAAFIMISRGEGEEDSEDELGDDSPADVSDEEEDDDDESS